MARRKSAPAAPPLHLAMDVLPPLQLNAADVARVGVVRASFDAVQAFYNKHATWEAARGSRDPDTRAEHVYAASGLARRTAEAHAQRSAV